MKDDTYSVFNVIVGQLLSEIDNKHLDGVFIKDADASVWGVGITEINMVIYDGVFSAHPIPFGSYGFALDSQEILEVLEH